MEKIKTLRFCYLRLNGIDYFVERIDSHWALISRYAPDFLTGKAEALHVNELQAIEGGEVLREWLGG